MNIRVVILIFISSFFSCSNKKSVSTDFDSITLPVDHYKNRLSDFVDYLKITAIKDSLNLINGYPEKLLEIDSVLALVDLRVNNEIYILDSNLNVTRKIEAQGEGPTEYSKIYDVVYNSRKKIFTILDLNKFIEYKIDGSYIRSVPFDYFPDRLDYYDGSYIVWNNNRPLKDENFRFYELSDDYKILSKQIPFNNEENRFSREPMKSVVHNENGIFFTAWMNDTLYSLSKKSSIVERTLVDFENSITNSMLAKNYNFEDEIDKAILNSNIWLWESPALTKDYLLSIVSKAGSTKLLLHHKKGEIGYLSSHNLTIDDALLIFALKSQNVIEGNKVLFLAESEFINEFSELCNSRENLICSFLRDVEMNSDSHFFLVELKLKDEITF